jgi:hypothetical protein
MAMRAIRIEIRAHPLLYWGGGVGWRREAIEIADFRFVDVPTEKSQMVPRPKLVLRGDRARIDYIGVDLPRFGTEHEICGSGVAPSAICTTGVIPFLCAYAAIGRADGDLLSHGFG